MSALFGLIKAIGARLVRFNVIVAVAGLVVGAGGVPAWTVLLPRTSIVVELA